MAKQKKQQKEYMTIFINGKQKRAKRPIIIDGMSEQEFIRNNADPIWLHQNEMWEYIDMDEKNQVQKLIFQIRKSLTITYHERLARRLLTLFNDAKEEDSDSLGISAGSLRNFYSFFGLHANLKCPAISLTPDYNIYASWRGEKNRVFSVYFLPNGDTRFVIFKPNDKHPKRKIRLSGTATNDTLLKTIESSGVWDWISE